MRGPEDFVRGPEDLVMGHSDWLIKAGWLYSQYRAITIMHS